MKKSILLSSLVGLVIAISTCLIAQQRLAPPTLDRDHPPAFERPARSALPREDPAGDFSFAQPNPSTPPPAQNSTAAFTVPKGRTFADPPNAQLQNQFAQVSGEIAQLLDDDELELEITKLQTRITELKARRKLRAATRTLEQLLSEFPDSAAAKEATRMLERDTNKGEGQLQEGSASLKDIAPGKIDRDEKDAE